MEFNILKKKINNELTPEENIEFEKWYNESLEHQLYYKRLKEESDLNDNEINQKKAWKNIQSKLEGQRNQRNSTSKGYAIAAILIVAIASSFFLFHNKSTDSITVPPTAPISDRIILTIGDGTEVELTQEDTSINLGNARRNGNQLIYSNDTIGKIEVAYNYLEIPRGEQFSLLLPDDTQIWLNSETKIKYPVNIIEGKTRVVEILHGEVFFDVTSKDLSNGEKFLVKTGTQIIEVVGTKFNVNAYPEKNGILTTLAEGEINLSNSENNGAKNLKPGFQGHYNPEKGNWEFNKVRVEDEISWMQGIYRFKDQNLKNISATISRWYDIEIFLDENIEDIKFNGVIRKSQSLENILKILGSTKEVSYEIKKDRVIIKNNNMNKNP